VTSDVTLIHEYTARWMEAGEAFSLDVYRLEGERQLETLGLDELLRPDALVLVEWGEKFRASARRLRAISISSAGGDARKDYGDA